MELNALNVVGMLAAAVLLQQVIAGFFRYRKDLDHHDEAVARKLRIQYMFDEDQQEGAKRPAELKRN